MKKTLSICLLSCFLCATMAGCAKNDIVESENNALTASEQSENNNAETLEQKNVTSNGDVDVDLTMLDGTMIYAEVFNMMASPNDYLGKTIKMSGPYYASLYDETNSYNHYVIIEDATACCQQGLEFVWEGDHSYPDDYPKDQTKIEVVGVFDSYEELGQTYYCLSVDDISIL